ncbi:hypothetical protein AYO21_06696 [Fonsecaea monophora]|uniref:SnoaL-like domain-containing protein n=1 Tax=Fonsecaea monophora TaxID=254056 RepID=A0A177F4C8_9EURO|nr:hypothetical protein AYO21_06696 [Fonsecaea monophora]OAG39145.1 hypothetical protein AYO21_06696 [Fonsecaea monophora]
MAPVMSDYEQIQNVVSLYCRCQDTRNWARMSQVFTPDAICDYPSPPLARFENLKDLGEQMGALLKDLKTLHNITSHYIEFTSDTTARSEAYTVAYHWGTGDTEGQCCVATAIATDEFVKDVFDGKECWRIKFRKFVVPAPPVGDFGLLFPTGDTTMPKEFLVSQ